MRLCVFVCTCVYECIYIETHLHNRKRRRGTFICSRCVYQEFGVAVYVLVLQCVAVCCSVLPDQKFGVATTCTHACICSRCVYQEFGVAVYVLVLQCVAVRVAVCCSMLQCVAVCCSVLQCVAVCCSVLSDQKFGVATTCTHACICSRCVYRVLQYVAVCCSV